jgi:hypothetical protein
MALLVILSWSEIPVLAGSTTPETTVPGLVAEYRLDKAAEGVVSETKAKWPGRVVGRVGFGPGRTGEALMLDGGGYVEIPGTEKLIFGRGLSVEAWICPDRLTAGRIVDRSTPGTSDNFCLDTHPGDAIRFITPAGTIDAPKVLVAGRWTHVIAVYDPDAPELAIYLDGKLAVARPCSRVEIGAAKNTIRIGADPRGDNRFVGKIQGVRLYEIPFANDDAAARFAGKEPSAPITQIATSNVFYRNGPQVDYRALLARNDVVYLSPAVHEHEAMPVGNGRLCAMVWNGGDGLYLQLNHANCVSQQVASGRVRIRVKPSPTDPGVRFEQRLSLADGAVRTRCRGETGQWSAATTVLEGMDVVAVHLEGKSRSGQLLVELEQWRDGAAPLVLADTAGFTEDLPVPQAPRFSRKMALMARADCPMVVGSVRRGNGSQVIPLILSPKPSADGGFAATVYIANPVVPASSHRADARAQALAWLGAAVEQGWPKLAARAAQRWETFWQRSFVHLTSPDAIADYMENLWYLHLFWMACGGEGELAVKFNGGPFLMHRDSRSWGTSYWYQNTRELYWCLPAANHLELCRGLQRLYLNTLPAHRKLAKELFGKRGLQVEETMAITGEGDKRGNPYTMLYLSTGLECALQLYQQGVCARDEKLLRDEVLPFMQEAVEFSMDYATLGPDGRYHISPDDARETYWRVQDGMNDISALRAALPVLLRESERLGLFAELRPAWKDFLDRLAPLPERPGGAAYGPCVVPAQIPASTNPTVNRLYTPEHTTTNYERRFNSENVELDCIYPFGLVGIADKSCRTDCQSVPRNSPYQKAVNAFRQRMFQGSYGWDWSPVCAARLGLADEAARLQAEHCRNTQHWPQGFWDSPSSPYWAGGLVDCPYFDSSGVNAATTAEMLLQSHGGTIRVWPAAPDSWTGAFRLRAETGFMVTSQRSAGEVRYIAVESLFGDPCRMVNPWTDRFRVSHEGRPVIEGECKEIRFPTQSGRTYMVERAAAPIASIPFAPLAPAPNQDVKYLANPRRLRTAIRPAPGLPMLGITRDGLTAPRAAAEENRKKATETIRLVVGERPAQKGVQGQWLDGQGRATPAPWLCDAAYGAATIPLPRVAAAGYLLRLPAANKVSAVVWSYDLCGERYDFGPSPREILVETSTDGRAWQKAARKAVPPGALHGHAASLDRPIEFQWARITFLDAGGKTVFVPCDEIEVR